MRQRRRERYGRMAEVVRVRHRVDARPLAGRVEDALAPVGEAHEATFRAGEEQGIPIRAGLENSATWRDSSSTRNDGSATERTFFVYGLPSIRWPLIP